MLEEAYSVTISGNVESCRTEAEIQDATGGVIGVVYEDKDGWHTRLGDESLRQSGELSAVLNEATQRLAHYVNRRGDNPPEGLTVGALALWLMQKDGGTAMGLKIEQSN